MPTANELRESVTNQILEAFAERCRTLATTLEEPSVLWLSEKHFGPQLQWRQSIAADTGFDEIRIQEPVLGDVQSMESYRRLRQTSSNTRSSWPLGLNDSFQQARASQDKNGDETDEKFWLLRSFVVFNADQVTGTPAEKYQVQEGDTDSSKS